MDLELKLALGLFGSFAGSAVSLLVLRIFVAAMNAPFAG